jgi:hypothetical protein
MELREHQILGVAVAVVDITTHQLIVVRLETAAQA